MSIATTRSRFPPHVTLTSSLYHMAEAMFIEYGSCVDDSVGKNRVRASGNSRSPNDTVGH